MGIKDINKIIGKYANLVPLKNYQDKKIGIDARNWMYRFLRSPAYCGHEYPILKGFVNQINQFAKYNITPVYVFDGKASEEKMDTLQKRKDQQNSVKDKIELLKQEIERRNESLSTKKSDDYDSDDIDLDNGEVDVDNNNEIDVNEKGDVIDLSQIIDGVDENDVDITNITIGENGRVVVSDLSEMTLEDLKQKIESLTVQTLVPTYKDAKMCKKLFTYTNIRYIHANGEADEILAILEHHKIIDAVLSADMDLLAYGTTCLLSDLKSSKEGPMCKEYKLENILTNMNWTLDQFVEFCILCGCDYVDRIPFLGAVTAKKFIDTHFTIENVVASVQRKKKTKMIVADDYLEKVNKARRIFSLTKLNEDTSITKESLKSVDSDHVETSKNSDVNIVAEVNVDNNEAVEDNTHILLSTATYWNNIATENIQEYTNEVKSAFFTKHNIPAYVPPKIIVPKSVEMKQSKKVNDNDGNNNEKKRRPRKTQKIETNQSSITNFFTKV